MHLFAVEQQQKQQIFELQQQQQQKCQQSDPGRASVEVIVDGDDDEEVQDQKQEIVKPTFSTESERCDNGRMSEETQVADESSASSSDTEGTERFFVVTCTDAKQCK